MVKVFIRYLGEIRDYMGRNEEVIDIQYQESIKLVELINRLEGKLGRLSDLIIKHGEIDPTIVIIVNDNVISHYEFNNIVLKDYSTVIIMPPVGGGS
ncbi:MAG: MoaD/ThiS family protein [Sulfolobales archaeon]